MNKTKLSYYAVVFISKLYDNILGYEDTAQEIYDLAKSQSGFLEFKIVKF